MREAQMSMSVLYMSLDGFIAGPGDDAGEGRRLFEHLDADHTNLELTRALEAPGVIHLHYRVIA
jgi:hypothetical protein